MSEQKRPYIEIEHFSFYYPERTEKVLDDLTLTVEQGEFLVLCGPSGCGKTTVTRLANGLAPTFFPGALSGRVTIDGRDCAQMQSWEVALCVGSVFQNPRTQFFNVDSTGEMAFALESRSTPEEEIRKRVAETVSELGIRHLADRSIFSLSGGEKQRVAFASAWAARPTNLVLDEPTSFLDIRYKLELLSVLKRMVREEYLAVLMSLHELDLAARVSDTVVCVAGDRIDRVGPPSEIFTPDYIAALYRMEPGKYDPCFDSLEFVPGGAR